MAQVVCLLVLVLAGRANDTRLFADPCVETTGGAIFTLLGVLIIQIGRVLANRAVRAASSTQYIREFPPGAVEAVIGVVLASVLTGRTSSTLPRLQSDGTRNAGRSRIWRRVRRRDLCTLGAACD